MLLIIIVLLMIGVCLMTFTLYAFNVSFRNTDNAHQKD